MDVAAVLAGRDMATERGGSATLDGGHHFQLAKAQVTGIGVTPSGASGTEDVRDLQPFPGHDAPALRGLLFLAPHRQQLQRALDGLEGSAIDLAVVGGGVELLMAQQHLDNPDIDLLLH